MWSLYPFYNMFKFIKLSSDQGVTFYNNYNHEGLRKSNLISFIGEYDFNDELPLYSNIPSAVYLFSGKDTLPSPRFPEGYQEESDILDIGEFDWPFDLDFYLIWINSDERRSYIDPQTLQRLMDLEVLFENRDGGKYLIQLKN